MDSTAPSHPDPHSLSLKVMRISQPLLAIRAPLPTTSSSALNELLTFDPILAQTHLPQEFGTIYVGQTFSTYICINNDSKDNVDGIIVSAELQDSLTKVLLLDTEKSFQLQGGASKEQIVSHEISEAGPHVLSVTLTYQTPISNDQSRHRSFRKLYKFSTKPSLNVRSKSLRYPLSDELKILVVTQIINVTDDAINLYDVLFIPTESWTTQDLNCDANGKKLMEVVLPGDIIQYMFLLRGGSGQGRLELGKIGIGWRGPMGERGRLSSMMISAHLE
ncbi:putative trafficking protein particle complex subunit 13 [Neolecta irregularis DAH-3]|uniref:Putative trafficking protein particle complex subunit 13 n=1 Tax=Neolecta irregularis (strain DAH-3) TaxID=1198029 RepID=A0A1U7LHI0_NEOID|nr:putative trafficking protein particle complex subunit 13 [Neolecta irregularis DAH-3]|eukprot:OLL22107.1 putative trafficking protein particle complex subunit 13 [Neolecta irregularis DAH-3]